MRRISSLTLAAVMVSAAIAAPVAWGAKPKPGKWQTSPDPTGESEYSFKVTKINKNGRRVQDLIVRDDFFICEGESPSDQPFRVTSFRPQKVKANGDFKLTGTDEVGDPRRITVKGNFYTNGNSLVTVSGMCENPETSYNVGVNRVANR